VRETLITGRWPLLLPDHRADRPEWYWWEAERLAHMHHFLGDGGHVVFDIGSEEGDFPALWATWGNDAVLLEPNPRVWPNIKAIWEANDLPRPLATFLGFAADETSSTIEFGQPWPEPADGPLIGDHGFCNLAERPDIQRCRIDDVARLICPPTAITIDVEGAELHVLRGAENELREHRPLVWVSVHPEFMEDMYGHDPGMIRDFMAGVDYEETWLCADHEQHVFWSPAELELGPR
jgi:FkbM family methyltransferase